MRVKIVQLKTLEDNTWDNIKYVNDGYEVWIGFLKEINDNVVV